MSFFMNKKKQFLLFPLIFSSFYFLQIIFKKIKQLIIILHMKLLKLMLLQDKSPPYSTRKNMKQFLTIKQHFIMKKIKLITTLTLLLTVNTNAQITGSLSISSSAANFTIEGNGFSQTQLSSNGALVLNPGSGGVGMAGVNQYITAGYIVGQTAGTQLTGSFTGSFAGNFVGTTNLPDLTQGSGITAFAYDGSTTATVAVSGASALSTNAVTKWTGNAFANSSITDSTNVTINNAGGVYVQGGGIDVSGSSTFHDNVVMQANLTVQGTASFQNVQNLAVVDQFILLNSGSSTFQDSGIVINTGNSANSGSAFFLETSGTTTGTNGKYGRFAVAIDVLPDATSATAAEYAVTTLISGSTPGNAVPQWGGTGLGQGNMWVDTTNGDIFIYA
jgi:hypothetical protein